MNVLSSRVMQLSAQIVLSLYLSGIAVAQKDTKSEELKLKFFNILSQEVDEMVSADHRPQIKTLTEEQKTHYKQGLVAEGKRRYEAVLTVPESEATQLLTAGPDDKANKLTLEHDIAIRKEVDRPLPIVLGHMQAKFTEGKITGGLELDMIRRIAEFHLRELGMLPK